MFAQPGANGAAEGARLWTWRSSFENIALALPGEHQRNNAATALATIEVLREAQWKSSNDAIVDGLTNVKWPGRLEWLGERPSILLDAAHNESGCVSLRRYLGARELSHPTVLLFAAMKDKNAAAMLNELAPAFDACVFTSTQMERSAAPDELAALHRGGSPRRVPVCRHDSRQRTHGP